MRVLERDRFWRVKPETASRVRGRIESILDWAKTRGCRAAKTRRAGAAIWKTCCPRSRKSPPSKHHPALPYRQVAGFMAEVRQHDEADARALELAILAAARSGEVLQARWSEFDLDERVWVIPGEWMKAGKEHRVPLSDAALAVLGKQAAIRASDYVFAAGRGCGHAHKNTLGELLKRLGRADLTAHGFRSTFSDWCAEQTVTPSEVREMALAHTVRQQGRGGLPAR